MSTRVYSKISECSEQKSEKASQWDILVGFSVTVRVMIIAQTTWAQIDHERLISLLLFSLTPGIKSS